RDRLFADDRTSLDALELLREPLQHGDSTSRQQARSILREYIGSSDKARYWESAVRLLVDVAVVEDLDLLHHLADRVYGVALTAIARLTGAQAVPILLPKLGDAHQGVVVEALGIAASGSGDPALVDAILAAARPRAFSSNAWVMEALLRIGGDAGKRGAVQWLRNLRYDRLAQAMNTVWVLRGMEFATALTRLEALGISDPRPNGDPRPT